MLGPGDPFKVQARLRGPDPAVLRTLAERVEEIAARDPETVDVFNDWRQRVPMLRPVVAKAQARNAGITRADIARAMEVAYEGTTMGVYREADLLLPIIARAPERERGDIENMAAAQVFSPVAGQPIPLGQVVTGVETVSENSIVRRRNRLPTVTVKWDAKSIPASALHARLRSDIEAIPLPPGYSLEWGGEYENSGKARSGLMAMLPTVAMVMVLIIVFLFNSIRKPLVIILTVPLAVIGVAAGLLIFDQPFGFMALLGFLSLSGMIIKNSVVLIDEINAGLATGKEPFDAVVASGVSRVRPVSMAALTTIFGMIPLVPDIFFAAMAVTIMCGLAFATLLTLIFVPVLYACMFGVRVPAR
jgi:multidrug efflux pump subunit AcrB